MRLLLPLLFLFSLPVATQNNFQLGRWTVSPILGFQGWATYTTGAEEYDPEAEGYFSVDDRVNFMLRRLRFGSNATFGDRLYVKFLGAADFVGSDQRSGTVGGVNNGAFPNLQVWDVFARYQLIPDSEGLYAIGGYFRPPIGRESISGAYGVSSFEKAFVQFYVRQHLTATGPGGAGGAYLGGMQSTESGKFHVDYRGGVFNAQQATISAGIRSSPLLLGRLMATFGDPEKTRWTHGLAAANSFGRRRGLSLAVSGATEGRTGASGGTGLLGADFLLALGHFHLEGEYHQLYRTPEAEDLDRYDSQTFSLRTGVNILVTPQGADNPKYLEPSVMVYGFRGATTLEGYASALATSYFSGEETIVDVGLNYHIIPNHVRLSLHYVFMDGERGEIPGDGRLSQYWSQPGIGGIRRGDYLGFEVILTK